MLTVCPTEGGRMTVKTAMSRELVPGQQGLVWFQRTSQVQRRPQTEGKRKIEMQSKLGDLRRMLFSYDLIHSQ